MNATPNATVSLRPLLPADVPVLAAIFQASIETLAEDDYDDGQRAAWSAAGDDEATFGARLTAGLTLVATLQGAPVGFVSLAGKEQLDMLYVYPPAARRGVGALLVDAIEKLARARGASRLTVDASDNARPFFETRGYEAQRRQTVTIGDQWLGNTHMVKTFTA